MTQSVSNIAFVAAYHEAKKVSQYGNSQTSKFSNYRLGVTFMIGTRWLAALSFEIPSSHGRAQSVRSNTALSFAAFQRPSAQWGETSKKCDRRLFSQVGFGKLCCLWLPDISPEKAPASHLPSKLSEKKKKRIKPEKFQIYIPCCLFVSVSWISFVIDPKVGHCHFPAAWARETRKERRARVSRSVLKIPQHCLRIGHWGCEKGNIVRGRGGGYYACFHEICICGIESNRRSVTLKIEHLTETASFVSSSCPPITLKTVKKRFGLSALIAGGIMCLSRLLTFCSRSSLAACLCSSSSSSSSSMSSTMSAPALRRRPQASSMQLTSSWWPASSWSSVQSLNTRSSSPSTPWSGTSTTTVLTTSRPLWGTGLTWFTRSHDSLISSRSSSSPVPLSFITSTIGWLPTTSMMITFCRVLYITNMHRRYRSLVVGLSGAQDPHTFSPFKVWSAVNKISSRSWMMR